MADVFNQDWIGSQLLPKDFLRCRQALGRRYSYQVPHCPIHANIQVFVEADLAPAQAPKWVAFGEARRPFDWICRSLNGHFEKGYYTSPRLTTTFDPVAISGRAHGKVVL